MSKVIRKNIKVVLAFLIGVSFTKIGVFALNKIESKDVSYTPTSSNVKNVQEAIEELYTLTKENETNGYIIVENGVRYTGLNPNNYVLFNNESWRIIGIFDGRIKIIKEEPIGNYAWNTTEINDWENSSLYNYLNTTYYNSLNSISKSMVENATWRIGGWTSTDITPLQMYEYEENTKGASSTVTKATGYIGLMSASDYGYASSECYKKMKLNNYSNRLCINTNWLKKGAEWTITPSSYTSNVAFFINGYANPDINYVTSSLAVRPSLYLKSEVSIKEGAGTRINPFILE